MAAPLRASPGRDLTAGTFKKGHIWRRVHLELFVFLVHRGQRCRVTTVVHGIDRVTGVHETRVLPVVYNRGLGKVLLEQSSSTGGVWRQRRHSIYYR